jgi:transcriptional regulator with XRE-family HTH domain
MPIGSNFDDFLKKDRLYEGCTARALKRVLAWQVAEAMKAEGLTKAELARRMKTSRAVLDRLLDGKNPSVTLSTISRAASALGRRIRLELAA